MPVKTSSASSLQAQDYVEGVLSGNRTILARAITLIESEAPRHAAMAGEVLRALTQHSGSAIRIGITGVPGVGKSTFIEALGLRLCRQGHQVAVLAVDPSSSLSHGSILGDKTRMERLSQEPNCFIRPSPSAGVLGGVARKSRETNLVCEAFGFDVILVETVGVGQSETVVRSMVDFFLVLMLTGAGDELQGIKRGIIELADALLVTKADGENRERAERMRQDLERVLHFLTPANPDWKPRVLTCSARDGRGIGEIWDVIREFRNTMSNTRQLHKRRKEQEAEWMRGLLEQELWSRFLRQPGMRDRMASMETDVTEGRITAMEAVQALLQTELDMKTKEPQLIRA